MNRVLPLLVSPLLLCSVVVAQPNEMPAPPAPRPVQPRGPAPEQSTPEKAARKFVSDAAQGIFEPSFPFDVAGARVGFYGPDDFEWAFKNLSMNRLPALKVRDVKVQKQTDNEATVDVGLGEEGTIGNPDVVSLELRREENPSAPTLGVFAFAWRVVPPIDEVL